MGRTRGAPPAPGAGLTTVLLLVALLLALAEGVRSQADLFLHAGLLNASTMDRAVAFVTQPGQMSLALTQPSSSMLEIIRSADSTAVVEELRWGPYFEAYQVDMLVRPRDPLSAPFSLMVLPAPGISTPLVVEYNTAQVAMMESTQFFAWPAPLTKVLAGQAAGINTASLLLLATPDPLLPRNLLEMHLPRSGMSSFLSVFQVPRDADPVLAVPGKPASYYVYFDGNIHHVPLPVQSPGSSVSLPLGEDVRGLVVSFLVSDISNCPGGDLVLLFSDGRVEVRPCFDFPAGSQQATLTGFLPPEAGVPGRFLNPDIHSNTSPLFLLYYVAPLAGPSLSMGLWQADVRQSSFSWRRVHLPSRGTSALATASLVRLAAPRGLTKWLLQSDGVVHFDSVDFHCAQDPTIVCDSASTIERSPLGWICAPDRAMSPFSAAGRLCDGCVDGFYLDRNSPGRPCQPCIDNCRTCDGPDRCLLCDGPLVLAPSGMACLPDCPSGFASVAGTCQPDPQSRPQADTLLTEAAPEELGPVPAANRFLLALADTHLVVSPADGTTYIPAEAVLNPGARRSGVLLFFQAGQPLLTTSASIGPSSSEKPAPVAIPPLGLDSLSNVEAFMEVGPLVRGTEAELNFVFCPRSQNVQVGKLTCVVDPGSENAVCSPGHFSHNMISVYGCRDLRRVDDRRILIFSSTNFMSLVVFDPYSSVRIHSFDGMDAVFLPPEPGRWEAVVSPIRDWILTIGLTQYPSVTPLDLLTGDSRQAVTQTQLLDVPHSWQGVNFLRTAGPGRRQREVVLSRVNGLQWEVALLRGDVLPSGRTVALAHRIQQLGRLPEPVSSGMLRFVALDVDWLPGRPGALFMFTDQVVGLAILHCPEGGGSPPGPGACLLQHLSITLLPRDFHTSGQPAFSGPVILRPEPGHQATLAQGAAPSPGHVLTLMAFSPVAGPTRLAFEAACPDPASFGLDCLACDPLCRTCAGPGAGDCLSCMHALPEAPGTCLPGCPAGRQPTSSGLCGCGFGCVGCNVLPGEPARCMACQPGHAPSTSPGFAESCSLCDDSCAECTLPMEPGACTKCHPLAWLFGGACVGACPSGFWPDSASGSCLPCAAGCAACTSASACTRCADRHFLAAGVCHVCDGSCASCASATDCTVCRPGLVFLGTDAGQASLCGSTCAAGEFAGPGRCAVPCGEHCSSCPGQPDTCTLCERGWLLASPDCVAECPAGSSPLGGLCSTCHGSCATCYGPGPEQCLTCKPDTPLYMDGRCHGACPEGTFPSGPLCVPCSMTCAACAGPEANQCTACPAGRALHAGACVQTCPEGWFPEDGPGAGGIVCRLCDPGCLACQAPGACTECPPGAVLDPAGLCGDTCPEGWHECASSRRCLRCPSTCGACTTADAACAARCTACRSGFILSPVTGTCGAACPPGEYSAAGDAVCQPCGPSCRSCFESADRCTGCLDGVLDTATGTCLSACPARSAPLEGVCLLCSGGCERCEAAATQPGCTLDPAGSLACPEVLGCAACEPGLFLLGGASCVAECPAGTFPDQEASPWACAGCHAECKACLGPEKADCLDASGPRSSRIGLAVGLAVGLLLLLILLILLVLFCVRRRTKAGPAAPKDLDAEDATMLNTIVELALPGAILVGVDTDFRPLDETLGAGTQATPTGRRSSSAPCPS
ncbi:hypothetical protein H696_05415 [Fonticula alba]|uniref:EGF-like domain-containing protein n=1 Tax=Fonticula alba TaxID=691883 RepID=A0A058Z1I6_FONAL|nr:hypothetical protein H696_05415 [Fonticula alba]KCV68149.1 hypothetical protein H696_05415 [Fonticula alba]|eukprot:XP_009497523.1 hypothetical protein H696_05415 [Fonticula alba]